MKNKCLVLISILVAPSAFAANDVLMTCHATYGSTEQSAPKGKLLGKPASVKLNKSQNGIFWISYYAPVIQIGTTPAGNTAYLLADVSASVGTDSIGRPVSGRLNLNLSDGHGHTISSNDRDGLSATLTVPKGFILTNEAIAFTCSISSI